ncbi:thioesterase domain-containing protein, partial [Nocardia zapadnayensis]
PDIPALTTHLATRLPTQMIPAAVLTLDRLPLTATGKLDYRALPAPDRPSAVYRPPATPLETTVCDAFAGILELERAGADDNFFDLGGNSLDAARLAARLGETTGADMPLHWVFTDPTPQALAHRIESRHLGDEPAPEDVFAVLLPLRGTGHGPPLFCVHPAIGLAWGFSGLVRYLDSDRPVHGLQSPALTEPDTQFATLDRLADRYVQEIRAVQPHGPYHLLGYSLGGTIAHAIAVRLRRDGEPVATLAMMDTRVVTADSVHAPTPTIGEMLTEAGAADPDSAELTMAAAAELLHRQGGFGTLLTAEHLTRLHRDYTRLVDLTWHHRPGLFDGDLIYFSAAPERTDDGAAPARAWADHITGRITEHRIPIRHEQMTAPDALRAIGVALTQHFHSVRTSPSPGPDSSKDSDHDDRPSHR